MRATADLKALHPPHRWERETELNLFNLLPQDPPPVLAPSVETSTSTLVEATFSEPVWGFSSLL